MILVDSNVLIALVDEHAALRPRATRDLRRARGHTLAVTVAVLAEVCFVLPEGWQRRRLRFLLDPLSLQDHRLDAPWRDEVFAWLEKYAEHEPDFADAELAVAVSRAHGAKVWTYDREFRTVWRQPNGTRIPLFVQQGR